MFEQILRLNPAGINAGLDISESMLSRARRRLPKHESFCIVRGDASKLPYPDDRFDFLINNFMLDLLPQEDYPIVFREFNRVLKTQGRLIMTTMTYGREWYSQANCSQCDLSGTLPGKSRCRFKGRIFAYPNADASNRADHDRLVGGGTPTVSPKQVDPSTWPAAFSILGAGIFSSRNDVMHSLTDYQSKQATHKRLDDHA